MLGRGANNKKLLVIASTTASQNRFIMHWLSRLGIDFDVALETNFGAGGAYAKAPNYDGCIAVRPDYATNFMAFMAVCKQYYPVFHLATNSLPATGFCTGAATNIYGGSYTDAYYHMVSRGDNNVTGLQWKVGDQRYARLALAPNWGTNYADTYDPATGLGNEAWLRFELFPEVLPAYRVRTSTGDNIYCCGNFDDLSDDFTTNAMALVGRYLSMQGFVARNPVRIILDLDDVESIPDPDAAKAPYVKSTLRQYDNCIDELAAELRARNSFGLFGVAPDPSAGIDGYGWLQFKNNSAMITKLLANQDVFKFILHAHVSGVITSDNSPYETVAKKVAAIPGLITDIENACGMPNGTIKVHYNGYAYTNDNMATIKGAQALHALGVRALRNTGDIFNSLFGNGLGIINANATNVIKNSFKFLLPNYDNAPKQSHIQLRAIAAASLGAGGVTYTYNASIHGVAAFKGFFYAMWFRPHADCTMIFHCASLSKGDGGTTPLILLQLKQALYPALDFMQWDSIRLAAPTDFWE